MTSTLIRGRLLSFHREPQGIGDSAAYAYESDGALLVENGVIMASGAYAAVKEPNSYQPAAFRSALGSAARSIGALR